MKIEGKSTVEAPRDIVWDALLDTDVLVSILPGCERLDEVGENQYEGTVKTKVGPVQGKFDCKIELADIDEPNAYSLKIDGRGPAGFIKADARVRLAPGEGDTTELAYDADAQVGGRVASVGQRLLDSSAKAITKQSLEAFNEVAKAKFEARQAGDETAVELPQKKSDAEFAAGVAKEVARDLIPPPSRVGVIAAVVAVLLAALWWFFA